MRSFARSSIELAGASLLVACASAPPAQRVAAHEADAGATGDDAGAPLAAPAPFDSTAAKKAIDAVDIASCQALPPFADETVRIRTTFSPSGDLTHVDISEPFAATPFGDCLRTLYLWRHIARFDGDKQVLETSVPRGPVRRDPTARFDAAAIRAVIEKASWGACANTPGAGPTASITVVVKPSGQIESVGVEGDYDARAMCIERVTRRLEFRPYSGAAGPGVTVDIELPTKQP